MGKKPDKIDVERALADKPAKSGGSSAESDIQIVEVVGGETGEAPEPAVQKNPAPEAEGGAGERAPRAGDAPVAAAPGGAAGDEIASLTERLKRMAAEHDNFRKRVERARGEQQEQANAALALDLLPVLDSFDRALGAKGQALPAEVRSGMELIQRQLLDTLIRAGLEPMQAVGEVFDPEIHDAVATTPDASVPAGCILEVIDGGYRFRGRLLRPARVRVSAGSNSGGGGS